MADRAWGLAKKLALGYVDKAPAANTEYYYIVTIKGPDGAAAGARGGLEQSVETLVPVSNVVVESGDTSVQVGWSVAETETIYTSYNIFRSPVGSNSFTKVNESPFLYGATDPDYDPKYAWFTDSVATYGDYKYYIKGRTPFGFNGPKSEVVTGSSRPGSLNLVMRLDSVTATETDITLHWESVVATHNSMMVAQRIYRSASVQGPFEVVSTSGLVVSARQWSDPAPLVAAYYTIELEDENGHLYRTQPQLGQLDDSTPPEMPTGFTGVDRGDGNRLAAMEPQYGNRLEGLPRTPLLRPGRGFRPRGSGGPARYFLRR